VRLLIVSLLEIFQQNNSHALALEQEVDPLEGKESSAGRKLRLN